MLGNLINLIPRDKLDGGGRCGHKKGVMMMSLIQVEGLKNCIEIGVWRGASLMYIVEGAMKINGHVTAIDPYNYELIWNELPDEHVLEALKKIIPGQHTLDEIHDGLVDIINSNGLEQYAQVIRACSKDVYENFTDQSIDFIHIDGNHDYSCVTSDIHLYLPKVKVGGVIIMDDTDWHGVQDAINDHLAPYVETICIEESWAAYRKIK
ncbi:class I SAM-dependent methyltransferase [Aeromonas hydrophila]|uniref:class I SAM-dependent methyltransferase n=1 Tax=Aeromonas hydrophila TaxID=644 RepID=UPI0011B0B88B